MGEASVTGGSSRVNQCQSPSGWLGRFVLKNMNARHSKVTDWGLSHTSIGKQDIILDVGCGGGRTICKLAAIAAHGKVYGVDHSQQSVAVARRTNQQWVDRARVEIREASVSQLPFRKTRSTSSRQSRHTFGGPLCRRICAKFSES